jgi:hypothetical protein
MSRGKSRPNQRFKWTFVGHHDGVNDAFITLLGIVFAALAGARRGVDFVPKFPRPFRLLCCDCEGDNHGNTRQFGFVELNSQDIVDQPVWAWSRHIFGNVLVLCIDGIMLTLWCRHIHLSR